MLGYTTEINFKTKEVVTTFQGMFRKERRTFCFNDTTFPLLEAMKVANEDMYNQIAPFIAKLAEYAERQKQ